MSKAQGEYTWNKMKQKVLIIEDKKPHMDALCKIINDLNEDIEIYCAYNGAEAYRIAMEQHIHLFLVDIILRVDKPGDVAGLWFVQEIRAVKKYSFAPVIFITSLEDPRLFSYSQLHCFGYIEKPFDEKQVQRCILQALECPVETDDERYVYFRKDGIVYSKYIKDIIYAECSRRRITIYCVNDKLEVPYKTSNEFMKELDSKLFIRCNRYVIINKKYIERVDYTNRYVKLKYVENPIDIGIKMKNKFKRGIENGYGDA